MKELIARWRRISKLLEPDKKKVAWESEDFMRLCSVQCTLERCADELEAAVKEENVNRNTTE